MAESTTVRVVENVYAELGTEEHARAIVEFFLDWDRPPRRVTVERLGPSTYGLTCIGGSEFPTTRGAEGVSPSTAPENPSGEGR